MPEWVYEFPPVDRLSPATSAAIHLVEHRSRDWHVRPGNAAVLLRTYRDFLRRPGRQLRLFTSPCPACPSCMYLDIAIVRDGLEAVAHALPLGPGSELRRLLGELDDEFRRRTQPDPRRWRDRSGRPPPWWHRRRYEDD
ncbi:hypothetical protein [Micromonospora deserti]|uniref:Uncharacterized protein n=1 Tax=Micromonospora deserti TaxID=2070366 RepID=A0A2W2DQX6_9ACTN|nr:hypothetical protein [Micromonospora deserti]PZG02138.1 hypothetical protein C1I99_03880 [Micromonospora deserti]